MKNHEIRYFLPGAPSLRGWFMQGWVLGSLPPCFLMTDRGLLITGFSSLLTSRHHDTAAPARSQPPANHDIHVAVQRGQKIHQAFDGKALQLEAISQIQGKSPRSILQGLPPKSRRTQKTRKPMLCNTFTSGLKPRPPKEPFTR